MREQWEQLRRELGVTIRHPRIVRLFVEVARQETVLGTYPTPLDLASHLEQLRRDPAGNALYLVLVGLCRRGPAARADLGARVLWLGLWPLLNRLYTRQEPFWRGEEDDLASEIARCLATNVRGTDLTRVESVALTLARNTERTLIKTRQAMFADETWSASPWADADLVPGGETHHFLMDVEDELRSLIGEDFELAAMAYQTRCDFDFLTRRFRLDEEEIRRRLRRAWRRVRRLRLRNRIE